jgi:hypothetical protein
MGNGATMSSLSEEIYWLRCKEKSAGLMKASYLHHSTVFYRDPLLKVVL